MFRLKSVYVLWISSNYESITSEEAWIKILEYICIDTKVRNCFYAAWSVERFWWMRESTADGFIPEKGSRKCDGGILLTDPFPLRYFHELGREVANIAAHVVFKSHETVDVYTVPKLDEYWVLKIDI